MKFFILAMLNFLMVGAKAFQQLSVVYERWYLIPAGSFVLAAGEVVIYGSVAITAVNGDYVEALFLIVALWLGATMGCWFSMFLHKKYVRHGESIGESNE